MVSMDIRGYINSGKFVSYLACYYGHHLLVSSFILRRRRDGVKKVDGVIVILASCNEGGGIGLTLDVYIKIYYKN